MQDKEEKPLPSPFGKDCGFPIFLDGRLEEFVEEPVEKGRNKKMNKKEPCEEGFPTAAKKLGEAIVDGASLIAEGAAAGAKFVAKKAGEISGSTQLHIRNALLRKKIAGLFKDLGELAFTRACRGGDIAGDKKVKDIVQKVKDCQEEIRVNEEKLHASGEEVEEENGEGEKEEEDDTQEQEGKGDGRQWRKRMKKK